MTVLIRNGRALFLLAAAVLVFYSLPLFKEQASIQWDTVAVHLTAQKYFSNALWSGKLPFWSPYLFSGMPFLADPQTGAWYPLNWPFFLIGITPRALEWELALHAFLACAGAFLLARELIKSTRAALLCSIAYGLSGFFAGHSSHLGMFQTAALFPGLLYAASRALTICGFAWISAAGLVAGCIVLAGHFQTALYCFCGLTLFLAAQVIRLQMSPQRGIFVLAGCLLLAITISSIQSLPGLELSRHSVRARADYSRETNDPLFPRTLVTLWSPNHYGAVTGPYTGPADITQFYFYEGLLLTPLALLGFWRSRLRWVAVALIVPAFWYALGPRAGVYLLIARLPGFRSIRAPVHAWFVIALGLALLAAFGFDELQTKGYAKWATLSVLVFTFGDLFYWNMYSNGLAYPRTSFDEYYGKRIRANASVPAKCLKTPLDRVWGPDTVYPQNWTGDARMEASYGYNPLKLARYDDFTNAAESNPKLLTALSITARFDDAQGACTVVNSYLPRVRFARSVKWVRDSQASNEALRTLDPRKGEIAEGTAIELDSTTTGEAAVTNYEQDLYRIQARRSSPGLLVIAVPYFPGWTAKLEDGNSLAVVPVDHALMGVLLPAGDHHLVFRFRSTWFLAGALISCMATITALWGLIWPIWRAA